MNISYLFDFDGTLVDSMPVFASSMLRILDENNISYGADLVKIITPLGAHGTVQYFRNHLGLKMSEEQMMQVMGSCLMDAYCYTIPAKNHVIPVLKELKRRGASLNILTASPHITLDACLKRLEIWDLFDNIWSCDDFNTTKADPDIYVQAAGRMHTTVDKVLFLDDNLNATVVCIVEHCKVLVFHFLCCEQVILRCNGCCHAELYPILKHVGLIISELIIVPKCEFNLV